MTDVTPAGTPSSPQSPTSASDGRNGPTGQPAVPYEQVIERTSTLAEWEFRRQGEKGFPGISLGPAAVSLEKGMGSGYTLTWTSDLPGLQSGFSRFSSLEEARSRYREVQSRLRTGIVERAEDQIGSLSLGLPGGADAEGMTDAVTRAVEKADREAIRLRDTDGTVEDSRPEEASDPGEKANVGTGGRAPGSADGDHDRSAYWQEGIGRGVGLARVLQSPDRDLSGPSEELLRELRNALSGARPDGRGVQRVERLLEKLGLPNAER